jgi:hypothetical protein
MTNKRILAGAVVLMFALVLLVDSAPFWARLLDLTIVWCATAALWYAIQAVVTKSVPNVLLSVGCIGMALCAAWIHEPRRLAGLAIAMVGLIGARFLQRRDAERTQSSG